VDDFHCKGEAIQWTRSKALAKFLHFQTSKHTSNMQAPIIQIQSQEPETHLAKVTQTSQVGDIPISSASPGAIKLQKSRIEAKYCQNSGKKH